MENKRIKDHQLRSTTNLNGLAGPTRARLNSNVGYGGWCPNQTVYGNTTGPFYTQFIQVKLDTLLRIKGIAMQGRANGMEKVERYWIAYLTQKGNWKWIHDEQTKNVKVRNFKRDWFSKMVFKDSKCMYPVRQLLFLMFCW